MKRIIIIFAFISWAVATVHAGDLVVECPSFGVSNRFDSIEIEKIVLNDTATILYCKGFHLQGYRISIARCYLQANGKKDPVRQAADKKIKIPSATVHAIKQKMQGLTDREEEITVPAPESRTNVKPFNKMQPGQGNLWKKETPKELLPP